MNHIKVGVLAQWSTQRAFGFIRSIDEFGVFTDYFLHLAQIQSGKPEINSRVSFIPGAPVKGTSLPALSAIITPTSTSFSAAN